MDQETAAILRRIAAILEYICERFDTRAYLELEMIKQLRKDIEELAEDARCEWTPGTALWGRCVLLAGHDGPHVTESGICHKSTGGDDDQ